MSVGGYKLALGCFLSRYTRAKSFGLISRLRARLFVCMFVLGARLVVKIIAAAWRNARPPATLAINLSLPGWPRSNAARAPDRSGLLTSSSSGLGALDARRSR